MNNNFSKQLSSILSIVFKLRFLGDGQAGEGELAGGGVAVNQLRGDVEEDAVVILVHIVERARRHVEEVLRGQPEGVHRRGHQVRADLLERNTGTLEAFASRPWQSTCLNRPLTSTHPGQFLPSWPMEVINK